MDVIFAGGTSLVSQWQLSSRFSEDIDLLVVSHDGGLFSASAAERLSRLVADLCTDAITDRSMYSWEPNSQRAHPMQIQAWGARGNAERYAKIDITEDDAEMCPWSMQPTMSILGRYASDDEMRACPELGGFMLPSLHFTATIGNKMEATVSNTNRGRIGKLRERARDIYDIASVAMHPEASQEMGAYLNKCRVQADTRNDMAGRFASSVLLFPESATLVEGTPENDAMRDGYQVVLDTLAWHSARPPSFDEAAEAARALFDD